MEIKNVHKRGVLFTFDALNQPPLNCLTNVYVIVSSDRFYICDTYLGPYYMKKIKTYLEAEYGLKDYVVFNSHHHWDHVWGNAEFKDTEIIAHEKCKTLMHASGEEDVKYHENEFAREKIELVLPNTTFSRNHVDPDANIEFFFSPGHSEDSASCFDYEDKTLFVGDNVDSPIPSFLCWEDLETYKATLEHYLTYESERVVQSHGDVMDVDVIAKNIQYLDDLIKGHDQSFTSSEVSAKHERNLAFIRKA